MKNPTTKDALFLIASILVASVVFVNIVNDFSKTSSAFEEKLKTDDKIIDPSKDFQSLGNYISYLLPEGWKKEDQIDWEFGGNTLLALTSPDYNSPEPFVVNSGVRIIIDRSYDPKSEELLNTKLNAHYEVYDYNIRQIKVAGKNAMTMHEDYKGHNRFIYIAEGNYLWQISITSKSLEDEQKYQAEVDSFLNSITFKD